MRFSKRRARRYQRWAFTNIKQAIKRESAKWYQHLKENQFEYIHEFKQRVNEIMDLQKRHYEIVDSNPNNPSIQLASLAALHKLNVTLSHYFDVVPVIGDRQRQMQALTGNSTIEDQNQARRMFKIEGCTCPHDGRDIN